MHVLLLEDDLDHLVDVKVEAVLHPALRLLELLLQVHYLIKKMAMKINNRIGDGHDDSHSQRVTSIDQQMVMNLRSDHNHCWSGSLRLLSGCQL